MFLMNQRGQQFEVFKLLIAVIMALAILMIILNSLGYFNSLSVSISQTRIVEGIKNAMKAPDVVSAKNPLIVKKVTLNKKTWTKFEISQATGLKESCISFQARQGPGSAFSLNSNLDLVVSQDLVSDVYVYCNSASSSSGSCKIKCTLSFGLVPVLNS